MQSDQEQAGPSNPCDDDDGAKHLANPEPDRQVENNATAEETCEQKNQKDGEEQQEEDQENVKPPSPELKERCLKCLERVPTSGSDPDSNDSKSTQFEFDPEDCTLVGTLADPSDYERTDLIPFPVLLRTHPKQLVSGFEFGEATRRQAEQNIKAARKADSGQTSEQSSEKPGCCSKVISELDHKTPHSQKRKRCGREAPSSTTKPDSDFANHNRAIPTPLEDWPECVEVWDYMIYKEEANMKLRNPRLFYDFKGVTPRMRAILLDWLMEVAEVYHLRRVTYYLSVDYFDRYLSLRPNIPKSSLQLVGITCLYIAAKVEEIYPPNLSEFSYVCDGACKSSDMVACELLILNSLGWEVISTVPSDWLNLYMQLHHKQNDMTKVNLNLDFNKDFIYPQYSAYQFTRASQMMDLLSLDPGFLKFSYSVVAAAAMYFMYGKKTAMHVSGLTWSQMKDCVEYMSVFYQVLKNAPDPRLKSCLNETIHPDDLRGVSEGLLRRMRTGPQNESYAIQTRVASMEYFEQATIYRLAKLNGIPSQLKLNCEEDIRPVENEAVEKKCETTDSKPLADVVSCREEIAATTPDNPLNMDEIFEYFFKKEVTDSDK